MCDLFRLLNKQLGTCMSIIRLSVIVKGLALVLVYGTPLFGDAIVDSDFDNKWNDFGHSWFYYDDKDRRDSSEIRRTTPSTPSKIQAPYIDDNIRIEFIQIKPEYQFLTVNNSDNDYGTMPFTLGSLWKTSWGTAQSFVGIGTRLTKDGSCIDLNSSSSIKFKIRSHTDNLTVRFMVQTKEIEDIFNVKGSLLKGDEFGYYGTDIFAGKEWSEVVVNIRDLKLPEGAREIPFNIRSVTKLVWEVKRDKNPNTITDTLDIDDVSIEGYVDPTFWYKTASLISPKAGAFASFDKVPHDKTFMNTTWYAFNDKLKNGMSTITKGIKNSLDSEYFKIDFLENTGSNGTDYGAFIEYRIGAAIDQGINSIDGFTGIGVDVYDSAKSTYWDAKNSGVNSIYFHYFTDGDAKMVTFEIFDKYDVGDTDEPSRMYSRGCGVVYYRNLTPTKGNWRAVEIPLDSLVYHDNWLGSKHIPLDKMNLAKIRWKVQGKTGVGGTLAIDNVYFLPGCECAAGVKRFPLSNRSSSSEIRYYNGNVQVKLDSKQKLNKGKISIYSVQGKLLLTSPLKDTYSSVVKFSINSIPSGLYILKLHGVDTNGRTVTFQSQVNIVR